MTLNLWEQQKRLKLVSGIIILINNCSQRLLNLHCQHKLYCHRLSIFHLELGLYFVDAEFADLLRLLREINDTEAVIGPIEVEPGNLNLHFSQFAINCNSSNVFLCLISFVVYFSKYGLV